MTRTVWLALAALAGVTAILDVRAGAARGSAPSQGVAEHVVRQRPRSAPLSFEANRGQTDDCVKFLARIPGMTAFVTPTETVFALHSRKTTAIGPEADITSERVVPAYATEVVRMRFVGANESPVIEGDRALPGKSNYFIGDDHSKWIVDVPHFEGVVLRDVYPGVDLRWHGDAQRRPTYDFVVAPGADVARIALRLAGARDIQIAGDGSLRAATGLGELRQTKPVAFQMIDGVRRPIDAAFALTTDGRVRFEVGAHDARRPLVVDPSVTYSTYLGGSGSGNSGNDQGQSIAADASGAVYVAGSTATTDFPTTQSAFQSTSTGGDAFVTKIDSSGSLVYSTYLGGSGSIADGATGIAVDANGAAYVAGALGSSSFPTQSPLFTTGAGFVTKLNASGSALVYSTYMLHDCKAIAVDGGGAAYVVGSSTMTSSPSPTPLQTTPAGGASDVCVAKLNSAGSAVTYSVYFGGTGTDSPFDIAVDSSGAAYVCGDTSSTDFPVQSAFQTTFGAGQGTVVSDAFVAKINATGAALVYATYLGGSNGDGARALAVDSSGVVYVTGYTYSADFPVQNAIQSVHGVSAPGTYNADCFVTKISASGSSLVYSTFLGGSLPDLGCGIAVTSGGSATVAGNTRSADFPTVSPTQSSIGGGNVNDVFVARVNSDGSALVFSTYLGGSADDSMIFGGNGLALDATGDAYVTGRTSSTNFPLQSALQGSYAGGSDDAFVIKYALGSLGDGSAGPPPPPPTPPAAPTTLVAAYNVSTGVTLSWTDASSDETGFRVERHPTNVSYALLATTGANATGLVDQSSLFPSTTYTYRVRAFSGNGASAWSNEASITTDAAAPIPGPPKAPSGLVAFPDDFSGVATSMDLSWSDNSSDETFFELEHAVGGAAFARAQVTSADVADTVDGPVHPGWPYSYRVRALSLQGPSAWSNTAAATIDGTIGVTVTKGALTDSPKLKHDRLTLTAKYASAPGAAPFDPVAGGLELQLGSTNAPVLLSIAKADGAWKVRKTRATKKKPSVATSATWKSKKGASPVVTIVFNFVHPTMTATVSGFDLAAAPSADVRTLVASGADGGVDQNTWIAGKAGVWRFKAK